MNYPAVDKHILGSMKRLFLKPNLAILNDKSPEALEDCSAATTIHEFLHAHWPFSGAGSLEEYWAENNPMEWVDKVVCLYTLNLLPAVFECELKGTWRFFQ